MSAFVDPVTRLSLIAGTATSWFQIPNVPGQPVGLNGNPPGDQRIRNHEFQLGDAQRKPV